MAGIDGIWSTFQLLVQSVNTIAATLSRGVAITTALPVYLVAALPSTAATGATAFASNGRKPGEGSGAGTGVQVFYDGTKWISVSSGALVVA